MAIPTFTPSIKPSPGTAFTPTFNIDQVPFGDGYTLGSPNGLNHIRLKLQLKWDGLDDTQMNEIYGFFLGRAGYLPFLYQPVGEPSAIRFTCKELSKSKEAPWKVSATLEQDFSNAV